MIKLILRVRTHGNRMRASHGPILTKGPNSTTPGKLHEIQRDISLILQQEDWRAQPTAIQSCFEG